MADHQILVTAVGKQGLFAVVCEPCKVDLWVENRMELDWIAELADEHIREAEGDNVGPEGYRARSALTSEDTMVDLEQIGPGMNLRRNPHG